MDTHTENQLNEIERYVTSTSSSPVDSFYWVPHISKLYKNYGLAGDNNKYLDYDPYWIEKEIDKRCKSISKLLNIEYEFGYINRETDVWKHNYCHNVLCLKFRNSSSDTHPFEVWFEVPVLSRLSNGSFFVKGYEQFITKGIRETLWDQKQSNIVKMRFTRFVFDPHVDRYEHQLSVSSVKVGNVFTILGYYLCNEEELFNESIYAQQLIQKQIIRKLSPAEVDAFEKRETTQIHFKLFELFCELNPVIKLYCTNKVDLLVKTLLLIYSNANIHKFGPFENEKGLNLIHRKVISEAELMVNLFVQDIVHELVTLVRKQRKRTSDATKHTKQIIRKTIEPSSCLYEHISLCQFVSPPAFYSESTKLKITSGEYCFVSKEVPDEHRDVHVTHLYNLCPISTSDKENTGLNLWLAEGVELDEWGRFKNLLAQEYEILYDIFETGFRNLVKSK